MQQAENSCLLESLLQRVLKQSAAVKSFGRFCTIRAKSWLKVLSVPVLECVIRELLNLSTSLLCVQKNYA